MMDSTVMEADVDASPLSLWAMHLTGEIQYMNEWQLRINHREWHWFFLAFICIASEKLHFIAGHI
jgi:hypothetical protein